MLHPLHWLLGLPCDVVLSALALGYLFGSIPFGLIVTRLAGTTDIRRIGSIKKNDEVIGSETRVKVVKNKVSPPFREAVFDILYGEGISRQGEIIDLGVQAKIVDKAGAWYSYNGERIGQGKDNAREFLRENADIAREIENRIRESLGVSAMPAGSVKDSGEVEIADEEE